jgi:hypothetical protein
MLTRILIYTMLASAVLAAIHSPLWAILTVITYLVAADQMVRELIRKNSSKEKNK